MGHGNTTGDHRLVLGGGLVFDGSGSDPSPADIAIQDGRIVDVGTGLDGDELVDVSGRTLLPGLIDCHVHILVSSIDQWRYVQRPFSYQFYEAARNLEATLRTGITTARDACGADLGIKRAVDEGLIVGPRLKIAVRMISQTGGHGDTWFPSGFSVPLPIFGAHPGAPSTIVDGADEMRRVVRRLVQYGADVIKVSTSGGVISPRDNPRHAHFRDDELAVLVAEAEAAGLSVMAHAQGAPGIKSAIRAGVRSIEHGIYLDDEAIDLMVGRGTWLVPTLLAPRGVIDAAAAGAAIAEASLAKARQIVEVHRESFRGAVSAGVRIAMGTDSMVTPHGQNLRELPLMVEGGMTPAMALVAATSSAASLLGVQEELGTLEPGKRADIVVVDGDVYSLDTLHQRVEVVYKDGVRLVG